MLPKVSKTTSADRRSPFLTHGSVVNVAVAAFAASDGVAIERNLFPEALSVAEEETKNSLCTKLAGDENQEPEKTQPPHDRGQRESSLPQSAFNTFGVGGRDADAASSFVSSSDEEKESASRARVLQRRGRARVRETGQDCRKHARGSQTSECIVSKIRDAQDPGVVCNIRPRIL